MVLTDPSIKWHEFTNGNPRNRFLSVFQFSKSAGSLLFRVFSNWPSRTSEICNILEISLSEGEMKRSLWSVFSSVILDRWTQSLSTSFLKWYLKPVWDKSRLRKSLLTVRGLSCRCSVRTNIRISRMTRLDLTGRKSDMALLNAISNVTSSFSLALSIKLE